MEVPFTLIAKGSFDKYSETWYKEYIHTIFHVLLLSITSTSVETNFNIKCNILLNYIIRKLKFYIFHTFSNEDCTRQ